MMTAPRFLIPTQLLAATALLCLAVYLYPWTTDEPDPATSIDELDQGPVIGFLDSKREVEPPHRPVAKTRATTNRTGGRPPVLLSDIQWMAERAANRKQGHTTCLVRRPIDPVTGRPRGRAHCPPRF